ncbi:MAG: late control protein D [Candidatus Mesenet longicola]|uniref:Late control protein D n=1 Tax=Candidatus Mesenet longicola TaxID=1892558 RepID=A0A8J3MP40_9RICK|nr:MAG: late control protein D [Candidatus Mesenet longicola]GHM59628.1 MAG: late control protein D [Candidatus Mesenet longicola]
MTPDFNIITEEGFVIENLKDRLISLRITDELGTTSDEAEICFNYENGALDFTGNLKVFLGYKEAGLFPMGVYVANEVIIQNPPQTVRIKAHAANLKKSLKEQVSKQWHQITLGNLVEQIAQKHGYGAKVATEFKDILVQHTYQTNESDMSFLTKVAREYGATVKPIGGYIIFVSKGQSKSATGKTLEAVAITPQDVINWQACFTVRNRYNSVIVKWYDYEKGETISETTGVGSPSYVIQEVYPSSELALSAAQAKLKQLKRSTATLDITMPGDPQVFTEARLNLAEFDQKIDGEWVINKVEHTLSSRGYLTTLVASNT